MNLKIAPSILSLDTSKLNEEIATVESFADLIHVDVMDGRFVPNTTFGPETVASLSTKLPLDLHLMIEEPVRHVEGFIKALSGSRERHTMDSITVHYEACKDLQSVRYVIEIVKSFGVLAAVSVNPETEISKIESLLDDVQMVLVMSVHPGFGGQKFIDTALDKVRFLRARKPDLDVEVDGGINAETAKLCVTAGANVLVAGTYIFGAKDRKKAAENLRTPEIIG